MHDLGLTKLSFMPILQSFRMINIQGLDSNKERALDAVNNGMDMLQYGLNENLMMRTINQQA